MRKKAGVWIDHGKAVIFSVAGEKEKMEKIESEVERNVRLAGGARTGATPWGPQEASSEHRKDARHKSQLQRFYRAVIAKIEDFDRIYIYGPGEAKIELKREMSRKHGLEDKIKKFETVDKMTDNQFSALMRKQFEEKA